MNRFRGWASKRSLMHEAAASSPEHPETPATAAGKTTAQSAASSETEPVRRMEDNLLRGKGWKLSPWKLPGLGTFV
jgi:hypothetical protein